MTPHEWLMDQFEAQRRLPYRPIGIIPRPILDIINQPNDSGVSDQYFWRSGDIDPYEEVITCRRTQPACPATNSSRSNAKAS